MAEIEPGYYWIRRPAGDYIIAEKEPDGMWTFTGSDMFEDDPGGEIVARIEQPDWIVETPHGTKYAGMTEAEAKNFAAKQVPRLWISREESMTTRSEQQALTPRDHSKIRDAYAPDPPPTDDVQAFAARAAAKQEVYEAGRRLRREAWDEEQRQWMEEHKP